MAERQRAEPAVARRSCTERERGGERVAEVQLPRVSDDRLAARAGRAGGVDDEGGRGEVEGRRGGSGRRGCRGRRGGGRRGGGRRGSGRRGSGRRGSGRRRDGRRGRSGRRGSGRRGSGRRGREGRVDHDGRSRQARGRLAQVQRDRRHPPAGTRAGPPRSPGPAAARSPPAAHPRASRRPRTPGPAARVGQGSDLVLDGDRRRPPARGLLQPVHRLQVRIATWATRSDRPLVSFGRCGVRRSSRGSRSWRAPSRGAPSSASGSAGRRRRNAGAPARRHPRLPRPQRRLQLRARGRAALPRGPRARGCREPGRARRDAPRRPGGGRRRSVARLNRRALDLGRRLRRHPLRTVRRRDREDHDQPPGSAQRISPGDADRGLQGAGNGPRGHEVGVIVLTGEGAHAFCCGGDQRVRGDAATSPGGAAVGRFNVLDLHVQIRRLPKPVVAMVAGYAIGGGHVLHLVCDLTIAADNARFGQTGPKVGSFDGGYGASLLCRASSARRRPRRSGSCAASTTRNRRWRWGSSTPSSRSRSLEEETVQVVPRDAGPLPLRAAADQGELPRRGGRPRRHPATRARREPPVLRQRRGEGGPRGLQGQAHARFRAVPKRP